MAAKNWNYVSAPPENDEQQRVRFQIELEFVQCLGNPNYLNFLAQRGYFKDNAFINYLKYLLYWKEPQYAKYLKYPMCLYFLDLLQYEHFRRELVNAQCSKFIDDQQILLWQHYTRRRSRLSQAPNANGQPEPSSNTPSNSQNGHMNTKIA
ncbi:PREDICTED: mediator of RNA polymerase II transcription subunit 31 [Nicrophorus vespilloides]|uniref:Mediator of RNA polymerase II transcription subunit 31 n=1 Tax=Nicrophorus vespilloides TaxID=110193 RepID=A0ABM1M1N2_NICVS|nr:PREDICTED: mediator of RNA polymerase II transcription subunit 31 [Nicrophorus vespilloides]